MYTTIIHPLRKAYCLSMNEYVVLDTIYHLSNNTKYGGWCIKSKANFALDLDLSKQTIHKIINKLLEKEFIEKNESTKAIRTTDSFNEAISNKSDWSIALNGEEVNMVSTKFTTSKESLPPQSKKFTPMVKKVYSDSKESLHYNNSNNNINNNINSGEVFNFLLKWLQSLEKVSSPKGLAHSIYQKYPEKIISHTLNNSACISLSKFYEFADYKMES